MASKGRWAALVDDQTLARMVCVKLFCAVVRKTEFGQKGVPIRLRVVDIGANHLFERPVEALCEAVTLRMERSGAAFSDV